MRETGRAEVHTGGTVPRGTKLLSPRGLSILTYSGDGVKKTRWRGAFQNDIPHLAFAPKLKRISVEGVVATGGHGRKCGLAIALLWPLLRLISKQMKNPA